MRTRTASAVRIISRSEPGVDADSTHVPPRESEDRTSETNSALRRKVILEVLRHLESEYGLDLTPDGLSDAIYSGAGIDSLFSFRSDLHLNDLRAALARLESGTFGICISCKQPIAREILDTDITMRVCPFCEDRFNHYRPD